MGKISSWNIHRIRSCVSQTVVVSLENALVSIRLDYCNSLLFDIISIDLHKLQNAQNSHC